MATQATLLEQAYKNINFGHIEAAIDFLEVLINVDPVNVEAWEAYMQISRTCNELDDLCDRVLQINEINAADRESILDYYYFLRQKIKLFELSDEMKTDIKFEVVDQFIYPLKGKSMSKHGGGNVVNIERGLSSCLNRALFVPYIAMMGISFNLVYKNNELGYWAILVLLVAALLGNLNRIFSLIKVYRNLSSN